jgi:transposase
MWWHHGKEVKNCLKNNPRFKFHFTPVHCSWINQVEQWFSIFQRKRFKFADFPSKQAMNQSIMEYLNGGIPMPSLQLVNKVGSKSYGWHLNT